MSNNIEALIFQLLQGAKSRWSFCACLGLHQPDASTDVNIRTLESESMKVRDVMHRVNAELGDVLATVNYHRNSFCPVNKLPPELLRMIFRESGRQGLHYMHTLDISWTCTRWRAVALADPHMWSNVDLSKIPERLAELFCERSKQVPLSIAWVGYPYPRPDCTFDVCIDHLPRIKALQLDMTDAHSRTWLESLHAPLLERLEIRCEDSGHSHRHSPTILGQLFGGYSPQLRDLNLKGIRMPWKSGSFINLTSLSIEIAGLGRSVPDDEDLLVIFRDSPRLRSLDLTLVDRSHFINKDPIIVIPSSPIRMRSLRSLRLNVVLPYMLSILESIKLPGVMTELSLFVPDVPFGLNSGAVCDILHPDCISPDLLARLQSLEVSVDGRYGSVLGFATSDGTNPVFAFSLTWPYRAGRFINTDISQIFSAFPRYYSLPLLDQLTISDAHGIFDSDVLPLINHVPSIETLRLKGYRLSIFSLMHAQCLSTETSPWPSLTTLSITYPDTYREEDSIHAQRFLDICEHYMGRLIHLELFLFCINFDDPEAGREFIRRLRMLGLNVEMSGSMVVYGNFIPINSLWSDGN